MADSIVAGLTQEQSHLSGSHNTGLPTPEQSQIHIATVRICRESFEGALLAVSPEDGYRELSILLESYYAQSPAFCDTLHDLNEKDLAKSHRSAQSRRSSKRKADDSDSQISAADDEVVDSPRHQRKKRRTLPSGDTSEDGMVSQPETNEIFLHLTPLDASEPSLLHVFARIASLPAMQSLGTKKTQHLKRLTDALTGIYQPRTFITLQKLVRKMESQSRSNPTNPLGNFQMPSPPLENTPPDVRGFVDAMELAAEYENTRSDTLGDIKMGICIQAYRFWQGILKAYRTSTHADHAFLRAQVEAVRATVNMNGEQPHRHAKSISALKIYTNSLLLSGGGNMLRNKESWCKVMDLGKPAGLLVKVFGPGILGLLRWTTVRDLNYKVLVAACPVFNEMRPSLRALCDTIALNIGLSLTGKDRVVRVGQCKKFLRVKCWDVDVFEGDVQSLFSEEMVGEEQEQVQDGQQGGE